MVAPSLKRNIALQLLVLVGLLSGCNKSATNPQPAKANKTQTPSQALDAAIRLGDWERAWQWCDELLITHPDDPDVLVKVARVAFENKKADVAADLLVDANRASGFQNAQLVGRATVALISVGKLSEVMKMLDEAVTRHPDQHESRRLLFDLQTVTEDLDTAIAHAKYLVRQRKFDFELLLLLSNTEKRTQDSTALNLLIERNPDDKRPMIGDAKQQFDLGFSVKSADILQEILQSHPNFRPARLLLGRALVDSGKTEQLNDWATGLSSRTDQYQDSWVYWTVLGDWARSQGKTAESARAYWEATKRNPDVGQVWSKLSAALNQLRATDPSLSEVPLDALSQRIHLLSRFRQQKDRFTNTGKNSKAIVLEIVESLRDLGRLWEAEAWAAMAMTLPEGDLAPIVAIRESLIPMLHQDTPWQTLTNHPELQLDLASLPLPSLGDLAEAKAPDQYRIKVASLTPDLRNEAAERGLLFFGKTAERLDQPGIMFYATLGCGGGSIDFDLDGWTDLYLVAAGGTPPNRDSAANALMRNVSGQFVDATAASSTGDTGFGQGVAVGDVNEDGFPDLWLLNYGVNRLLINNGDGTFTDVSDNVFRNPMSQWSASGAIADINGDGLSDLIAVNYCAGLTAVTDPCTKEATGESRACSPLKFSGEVDVFWQATETGDFIDVTETWGAQPSIRGRGLGLTVGSFDSDPGLDVFIVNDMSNNHYWSRTGSSEFQLGESAVIRGLACDDRSLAQGSMGIATADLDRDGDTDFYVTNFENEYNTLHMQRESGIWQDRTAQQLATATLPMVGFGTESVDFDNDGNLELAVTNGHVDFFSKGDRRAQYFQPMQIFRRNTSATFDNVTDFPASNEYLSSMHAGRALWTTDVNRDGQADLVVTHQTEPIALLVNHTESKNHSIAIRLCGRECARDAIGAVINVQNGPDSYQQVLTAGDGYLCSNERVSRFGLGPSNLESIVTIQWPDGSNQTAQGLVADTQWLIIQGEPAFELTQPH